MHKNGFSLVELSIVLVILGLLVGGVLTGQSLIQSAEMRAQLAQTQEIKSAIMSFRDRYMCLPGDCNNMTAFFPAAAEPEKVINGNGDGRIYGYQDFVTPIENAGWHHWGGGFGYNSEHAAVFDHLAASGLIAMGQYDSSNTDPATNNIPGVGFPKMKYQGKGTISDAGVTTSIGGVRVGYEAANFHIHGGNKIRWGSCTRSAWGPHTVVFNCGLNAQEAYHFDTKVDDGKPLSGGFYATASAYVYRVPGSSINDLNNNCIIGTTNEYKLSGTSVDYRSCFISIDGGF